MIHPRLLLVDDEPITAALLGHIAESCGYEVVQTHQADAFRDAYASFRPHVVTLDLVMPKVDGIEMMRYLARQDCTVPIVLISGLDRQAREAARRLGQAWGLDVVAAIAKPIDVPGLKEILLRLSRPPV